MDPCGAPFAEPTGRLRRPELGIRLIFVEDMYKGYLKPSDLSLQYAGPGSGGGRGHPPNLWVQGRGGLFCVHFLSLFSAMGPQAISGIVRSVTRTPASELSSCGTQRNARKQCELLNPPTERLAPRHAVILDGSTGWLVLF